MSSEDSASVQRTTDAKAKSEAESIRSEQLVLTGKKSPGVARIEAINAHLTFSDRIFLGIGVLLIAYAYTLDGTVRYTYQVRNSDLRVKTDSV